MLEWLAAATGMELGNLVLEQVLNLEKAFETDCKQIDYSQLQQIWTQQYQVAGWQFPAEEFDWRGVAKEYGYEVKGIIKANPELRSLLNTELLESIARNTA